MVKPGFKNSLRAQAKIIKLYSKLAQCNWLITAEMYSPVSQQLIHSASFILPPASCFSTWSTWVSTIALNSTKRASFIKTVF